ncbi:MAG TPA: efflux RND transporter periplasmic adaptor subunit [Bryobacteraceae bacterium]|nr:efflux RND transporter periplasmic adaptor subunit [Bryobacteraceae bacterium]
MTPKHFFMTALGLVAGFCVMTGCSKEKEEKEKEPVVPVQIAEAKRDSIDRIISAQGVLFPVDQANVMPKISAPVKSFSVKRGDHVAQGQVVAILENKDLVAAVNDSKAAYEQAQSALRQMSSATVPEDLNKAQQDMQAARQAMDAAQKVYESRKQLFDQGALARRLVDEANVAYVQARSTFEIAQRHLQATQNVSRVEQVKGAEAQAQSAKAKYEGAQAQLSYSEIRSPIAGVIADRPLYPGEVAAAGSPLLTVVNISRIIARANVPVSQAGVLKVGQTATISQTDAAIEASGKVTVVSPAVDPNSTTIEIWVEAANPGERFKPGATVKVDIHAETIKDAVVIPTIALLPSAEGGVQVLTVSADSKAHEKKVEVGIREPDKVQILKGVDAGESVITVGGVGLEDGAQVTVKKAGEEKDDKDEKDKGDKSDKDDKSDKK